MNTSTPTPVRPSTPQRPLGHPLFNDLIDVSSDTNQTKVTGLFYLVLDSGVHTLKTGSTATKNAWIKLYDDVFCNDGPQRFGVFGMHKRHSSKDYQNKLKDLVFRLAAHYSDLYKQRESTFTEDNDDAAFTVNEINGHKIMMEQQAATDQRKQAAEKEKAAAIEDRMQLEEAEAFLGATPPSTGVQAPSGIEMNADITEGLGGLGAQPRSKTGELID